MFKALMLLPVLFLVSTADAKPRRPVPGGQGSGVDIELVRAANSRSRVHFVRAARMEVIRLLPDDREGRPHQKFVVRLSNGLEVTAVSNLDLCEYIPVKVGMFVGLAGEFIWTNQGALIHWLHRDPRKNRPDGYVELNGKFYCL